MIPAKIAYLMVYGAVGTILPFINIFFVSIGCTEREAGVINGVTFGVNIIVPPLSGFMMDSIKKKRPFTIFMLLVDAISIFSMPLVAAYINPLNLSKKLDEAHMKGYSEHNLRNEEFTNSLFWSMMLLLAITRAGKFSLLSFLDAAVTDSIKHIESHESFGQQVMGMPLGLGVASFIASAAAQAFHSVTMSKYSAVLFVSLPFNLLAIPFIFAVYNNTSWYDTKLPKNDTKDDATTPTSEKDDATPATGNTIEAKDNKKVLKSNLSDDSLSSELNKNLDLNPKDTDNDHKMKNDRISSSTDYCKVDDQTCKTRVLWNTVFQSQMLLLLSSVFVIGCFITMMHYKIYTRNHPQVKFLLPCIRSSQR